MCFELINVKTLLSDILRRNLWYFGPSTSNCDSTINKLLTGTSVHYQELHLLHQQRLSILVCKYCCRPVVLLKTMPRRSQGQLVGGGQWGDVWLYRWWFFIQLSVTFFSLDVNESDVKERSAPGVGLLHTRGSPHFTLHPVRQSQPLPTLTVYHCQLGRLRGSRGFLSVCQSPHWALSVFLSWLTDGHWLRDLC